MTSSPPLPPHHVHFSYHHHIQSLSHEEYSSSCLAAFCLAVRQPLYDNIGGGGGLSPLSCNLRSLIFTHSLLFLSQSESINLTHCAESVLSLRCLCVSLRSYLLLLSLPCTVDVLFLAPALSLRRRRLLHLFGDATSVECPCQSRAHQKCVYVRPPLASSSFLLSLSCFLLLLLSSAIHLPVRSQLIVTAVTPNSAAAAAVFAVIPTTSFVEHCRRTLSIILSLSRSL